MNSDKYESFVDCFDECISSHTFRLVPSNVDAVYEFCEHFPKHLACSKEDFCCDKSIDITIDKGLVTVYITDKNKMETAVVSYTGVGCARYWYEDKTYLQEFDKDKRSFTKVLFDEFDFIIDCDKAKLKE